MPDRSNHNRESVNPTWGKWEQDEVAAIRQLLRSSETLTRDGKAHPAKHAEQEAEYRLSIPHKRIEYRLKSFARKYIQGRGVSRQYMAPVVTAEELHAEYNLWFVQEVKMIDGTGNLDWENFFFNSLYLMAQRATRTFLANSGFNREATSWIPLTSLAPSQEDSAATDPTDEFSKEQFHDAEIGNAVQIIIDATKRDLRGGQETPAKSRIADRRVQILELMLEGKAPKQMREILGASDRTVFDDIGAIRKAAQEVMKRLGMIPSDLLPPRSN